VALSRPGLPLEVPMLERDLLEIVDRHVELSRAGLRREVARLLRFRGREVGAVVAAGP
jgi:septum formation topological specificity factor MinE